MTVSLNTSSAIILSSSCLLFDSPMAFTRSKKSRPIAAAISPLNVQRSSNDKENNTAAMDYLKIDAEYRSFCGDEEMEPNSPKRPPEF